MHISYLGMQNLSRERKGIILYDKKKLKVKCNRNSDLSDATSKSLPIAK
jgi:hypothetical protein